MPTPTEGDDILNGTYGADTISALGGNDTLDGESGSVSHNPVVNLPAMAA